uniref:TNRC6 PABC binding domain-containing protein n=1 Tax=Poecilia mexicana TaxID=48701 RepID=A0A3B3WQ65_9TELE
MEDKKRKKEDKRKREASQKSSSASPSPVPAPTAAPSPATSGPGSAAPPAPGGNNAKRLAVANGQPPSRYMPREVPPRFRCQQDHKVLLKRGQPPLSSMLLGGGGDGPNTNMAAASGKAAMFLYAADSASSLALTSPSVAASTNNYANSMWGASSGSQVPSQGKEKVIVDGNDLEEWPSIAGSDGGNGGTPVTSISASGGQPSPTSSFSLPNECMQLPNSAAWGSTAPQGHLGGGAAGPLLQQPSSVSKAPAVPGSHDASGPLDGSSGIPGANFSPNANPSAWPALVQQDGPAAANNAASMGLGGGAAGGLGGHPSISVNQSSAHQHQLHQMQSRDRDVGGGKWDGESAGPNISGGEGIGGGMDHGVGGGRVGAGDPTHAPSWRGQPYPAACSKTGASRTDGWEEGAAEGDKGTLGWGYPSAENGGQTSGASQGGWGLPVGADRGVSSGDWGGGSKPAAEEMGNCSSSSSSSGGSTAGNPPTAGSGPNGNRIRRQAPNAEAALQNLLSRSDLDPRVLSNSGWGQTQIRQNTAWDVEEQSKASSKHPSSSNSSSSGASLSGRGPPTACTNMRNMSQSGSVAPGVGSGLTQGKAAGWGGGDNHEAKDWGGEDWRGNSRAEKGGGWGEVGQQEKGTEGWKDVGGNDEGSGWGSKPKVGPGKNWLEQESKSGGGWDDERRSGAHSGGDLGGGGWGNWDSPPAQPQQSQPRNQNPQLDQGAMQGGGGGRKMAAQAQNQSSGWNSGPIPAGGGSGPEPSGWEEPSPQSISRKSEIDDGTSAWGDPTHYNYKPVNLWDKNSGTASQQPHGPEPSGWGGASPAAPAVDNGTAAWGKPSDAPTGWGEADDAGGKPAGWGNAPSNSIRSGSKSMQDGWGEKESSVAASRHSSWEDEEDGGGMWNSAGSQGSGSSWGQGSNGGWGQGNPGKKTGSKLCSDSWMSPINRQFSHMGILSDEPGGPNMDLPPEKKLEAEKRGMAMNDYNGEMRKGGRGPSGGMLIFGGTGGMSQSRHQPGVPPINQSPGMRAQVPHQFLSAQVTTIPTSCFPGRINVDSRSERLSVVCVQACQLLLQQQQPPPQPMLQNQRKFSPNVRQQPDPQQVPPHLAAAPNAASSRLLGYTLRKRPVITSWLWVTFVCFLSGPVTPIKMPGASHYSQFDLLVGEGASDGWHRTPGNKMAAKPSSAPSWPPEFQPGVPWKGIDRVDPESDPYMTPGSMMGNAVSPGLNDSEHQLLQDNTGTDYSTPPLNTLLPSPGAWPYSASDSLLNNAHNSAKYTDYKTSWPPEPIGHKSWKASRSSIQAQLARPPPGLAGQKPPSSSPWSGGAPRLAGRGWGSGSTWSDGNGRESCWLVLSNLTPQIDGSTLRTICMQHGPLLTFHLGLTQGTALIRYGSKQEAAKAQSALHMCVLGNTTILAEFVSEEEVALEGSSLDGGPSDPAGAAQATGLGIFAQWSSNGGGAAEASRPALWGGMGGYPGSGLWASPALEDRHQMGSPASLLPGDLLGGGTDSI